MIHIFFTFAIFQWNSKLGNPKTTCKNDTLTIICSHVHGDKPFGTVIGQYVQELLGMSLVIDPLDSTSKSSL